jgi:hypothetical protein
VTELVRFAAEDGSSVIVEVDDDSPGVEQISRDERGIAQAAERIEAAFGAAKPAIRSLAGMLKQLAPDEHEVEFGLKLTAEAGAIVAKTAGEAHFKVKLHWRRETPARPVEEQEDPAERPDAPAEGNG